jgi:hypothetical protein
MGFLENFDYIFEIIIGSLAVLLIWNVVLTVLLLRNNKKLHAFTDSGEIVELEDVIVQYKEAHQFLTQRVSENGEEIRALKARTRLYKGNVELLRYNAFDQVGQNLSYSVVFIDENGDGVVISSIYAQTGSNSYAKLIQGGVSEQKLSPEEQAVIKKARGK